MTSEGSGKLTYLCSLTKWPYTRGSFRQRATFLGPGRIAASLIEPPHDKNNKMMVRPAKTRNNRPVRSESLLCSQWVAVPKYPRFFHAYSEDWSDWADAQADLSLRWAHSPFVGFVMRRLIIVHFLISVFTFLLQKSSEVPHPFDTNYGLLNCKLELVSKTSEEFKVSTPLWPLKNH